jgi:hypothetical protein
VGRISRKAAKLKYKDAKKNFAPYISLRLYPPDEYPFGRASKLVGAIDPFLVA